MILCPICKSDVDQHQNEFLCNNCKKQFPIKNKVAILVPDPENHLKFINKKIKEKENWLFWFRCRCLNSSLFKKTSMIF